MSRAEQLLDIYSEQITALRRHDAAGPEVGASYANAYAAFGVGYLMGGGMPQAAATFAYLYRRAYPGQPFPVIWEGER